MVAEYKVRLEAFEGPLDLLLFLIRRAEVDIHDIPIASITEQYLSHLEQLTAGSESGRIDIERAGEFLVMAATLMEIKSRMLAPPSADGEEPGDSGSSKGSEDGKAAVDPRAELVRQLLDYKRYRDATERLEEYRTEWDRRFPGGAAGRPEAPVDQTPAEDEPADLEDVDIVDLVEAFARIIETVDLARVGEHRVVIDETPVEIHAEDILDQLRRRAQESLAAHIAGTGTAELEFAEVFAGRTRSEMIGLFLAMLELVRQRRIAVRQESSRGTIYLGLEADDEPQAASATSEQSEAAGAAVEPAAGDHEEHR
ncbi:MAG: segregation/condensation protein A [Phycisphaeraceae bacterium]|nr:segregation/condensation protein A [Phycisphaeraceae bacterium]